MKTLKTILQAGLLVVAGCVAVALAVIWREASQLAALQSGRNQPDADSRSATNQAVPIEPAVIRAADATPVNESVPTEATNPVSAPPEPVAPEVLPARKAMTTAAAPNPVPRGKKPPPQDPLARDALFLAGVDPDAEQYWALAINDPSLPPSERQDLIEDLNEEGFTDPRNLTADDLPLILNRIALIERHVGDAMDEVNAAAFMEAYKDLWNMLARASQW